MQVFEEAKIGGCRLKNRLIRSATFEGMADVDGFPSENYRTMYRELAENELGGIITGFVYISKDGKAMQPGQAGMDHLDKIPVYRSVTNEVHQYGGKIFLQLAHTGRQTRQNVTGEAVWGVSPKPSFYFGGRPQQLTTEQVYTIIERFADAAVWAKEAGFDGVQLHAAHGYLIHQFILPETNTRNDLFKINPETKIGSCFLEYVIDRVRQRCGPEYPILVKVSGGDDYWPGFSRLQFEHLIRVLDAKQVDAIEISYGTMDYALNIFRGGVPAEVVMRHNPVYQVTGKWKRKIWKTLVLPLLRMRLRPFTPLYNLEYALMAKKLTSIPILYIGGVRSGEEVHRLIEELGMDFVSLCRPLLCEPDMVKQIRSNRRYTSKCINCNVCAVMCDSNQPTRCYRNTVIYIS